MTKTAKLYGGSLYDLAAEESLTESVMEEMDVIRQIFRENPDYLILLSEPSIPRTERVALLNKAFDGQIQPYLQSIRRSGSVTVPNTFILDAPISRAASSSEGSMFFKSPFNII